MELIPLGASDRKGWDEFCLASPDGWFWHTTEWLDWVLAYRQELKPRSFSFLCREGKKILAVAPLVLTEHEEGGRKWKAFTYSGNYTPTPAVSGSLSPQERDEVSDFVYGGIDDLAAELGVAYSRFRIDSLRPSLLAPKYAPFNVPLKHGYLDCSINTQLIDLRLSRNELRDGLRRNHLRSIEKGKELFQIRLHSGMDLTDAKFEQYVAMHARAAGRSTRARATFDMMRTWIQSGRGLAAEAVTNDGVTAGFELYVMYKNGAYGLSACNEPEYEHLPIRHQIEWEAINWLRKKGTEFYEIGPQHFGTLPYDFPEKKNVDISHFKYGFGGATVPAFYAERFYDAAYWAAEQKRRTDLFAARYAFAPRTTGDGKTLLAKLTAADSAVEPESRPEETGPIPPALLDLAAKVIKDNAAAVAAIKAGDARKLHFLVGKALSLAKGHPPVLVRRAVEARLAEAVADWKKT